MRHLEKFLYLRVLDTLWIEHLENMEHLRDSVRLRAYGQQDPLVEYKREGHRLFKKLLDTVDNMFVNMLFQASLRKEDAGKPKPMHISNKASFGKKKIGRNDPCPCGSGKKYKKCHGR